MKWKQLQQWLERMSAEELDQPVLIYNPYYGRIWPGASTAQINDFEKDGDMRPVVVLKPAALK